MNVASQLGGSNGGPQLSSLLGGSAFANGAGGQLGASTGLTGLSMERQASLLSESGALSNLLDGRALSGTLPLFDMGSAGPSSQDLIGLLAQNSSGN